MQVHLCGVRGSTPAPGADFVRHGGHTSCVAIAHEGEAPTLILDAGTGLRRLTGVLAGEPFRGSILLGHLHWDHTQGLPFFAAGDRTDAVVTLYQPAQGDPIEVLSRAMSPPHFPIDPLGLRGRWRFEALEEGEHTIEGFRVLALEIPHKGGRTFGYRITDGGGSSVAYLSDHGPGALGDGPDGWGPYHDTAVALVSGVDVLLHDAQHTAEEFPTRRGFGHSCIDYAVALAARAGAGRLLLFHHDPNRTDDEIDALVRSHQGRGVEVAAASEGDILHL